MVKIQDGEAGASIRVSVASHIATVLLDRPGRKNAVTGAMWRELARYFRDFSENDDVRVVVIAGSGPVFCAGADISEFDNLRSDASAGAYEAANEEAFAAIRNCGVPVIAAIRGICFGGGFGIAAAADLRLASPDAEFSVPAARLGLAYPVQAMADIVNSAGSQMARYLTYTAGRINAEHALAAGFILEIVDDGDLDARVAELARQIVRNAPLSVRASKASISAVLSGTGEDFERALKLGKATFASEDYLEGRRAFAERRPPVFKGR